MNQQDEIEFGLESELKTLINVMTILKELLEEEIKNGDIDMEKLEDKDIYDKLFEVIDQTTNIIDLVLAI